MPKIAIHVEFRPHPGSHAAFDTLIREHARLTQAEEPGCERFDVLQPLNADGSKDEGRIMLVEVYTDRAAVSYTHLDVYKRQLEHSVTDLFPRGGDVAEAQFWTGLRPMTPDGTPVVGPTRFRNMHLNTGHGTLGWTMACGSGRLLADLVTGKKPEIEAADLSLERYAAA